MRDLSKEWSVLHYASSRDGMTEEGFCDIIERHNITLDERTPFGWTVLHVAADAGCLNTLAILLGLIKKNLGIRRYADLLAAQTLSGSTASDLAKERKRSLVVKLAHDPYGAQEIGKQLALTERVLNVLDIESQWVRFNDIKPSRTVNENILHHSPSYHRSDNILQQVHSPVSWSTQLPEELSTVASKSILENQHKQQKQRRKNKASLSLLTLLLEEQKNVVMVKREMQLWRHRARQFAASNKRSLQKAGQLQSELKKLKLQQSVVQPSNCQGGMFDKIVIPKVEYYEEENLDDTTTISNSFVPAESKSPTPDLQSVPSFKATPPPLSSSYQQSNVVDGTIFQDSSVVCSVIAAQPLSPKEKPAAPVAVRQKMYPHPQRSISQQSIRSYPEPVPPPPPPPPPSLPPSEHPTLVETSDWVLPCARPPSNSNTHCAPRPRRYSVINNNKQKRKNSRKHSVGGLLRHDIDTNQTSDKPKQSNQDWFLKERRIRELQQRRQSSLTSSVVGVFMIISVAHTYSFYIWRKLRRATVTESFGTFSYHPIGGSETLTRTTSSIRQEAPLARRRSASGFGSIDIRPSRRRSSTAAPPSSFCSAPLTAQEHDDLPSSSDDSVQNDITPFTLDNMSRRWSSAHQVQQAPVSTSVLNDISYQLLT